MRRLAPVLIAALAVAGIAFGAAGPQKVQRPGPVKSATEAKAIAEQETGGIALSARRTYLNGASCGWEVEVHMPKDEKGWRCIVDCDTHRVFTKERIPNPPRGKKK